MAQYVTKIKTDAGDLQIDYNALANLPDVVTKEFGNETYVTKEHGAATYAPNGMVHETVSYTEADEDTVIANQFAKTVNNRQRIVYAIKDGSTWFWLISKTSESYGCVIAYKYGYYGTPFVKYKNIWDGVAGPWSVANPEMLEGVEYRTTEYWRGYPVYTKLVNFGALPNNTKKSVSYTDTSIRSAIRCNATTSAGDTIPLKNGSQELYVYASNKNIHITSNYDASSMTGYAQVWYVKNNN